MFRLVVDELFAVTKFFVDKLWTKFATQFIHINRMV